jgi:hypothetical protein
MAADDYKRAYEYLNGLSDDDLKKGISPCKDKVETLVTQLQQNVKAMKETPAEYLHPFNWIISGASQSGKTHFLSEVLRLKKIRPMPDSIHLFRGVEDSEGRLMQVLKGLEATDNIEYNVYSGDQLAFVKTILDEPGDKLIILDDLMAETVRNRGIANLFTCGTHHKKTSAVLLWQDLFPQGNGNIAQTLARNVRYLTVFPNANDHSWNVYLNQHKAQKDQLRGLYRQMKSSDKSTQPLTIAPQLNYAWLTVEPDFVHMLS